MNYIKNLVRLEKLIESNFELKKKNKEANLLDYQVDPIEWLVHCNIFSFVLSTILLIFILLVREFG
jgi:hypothetical protein